MIEPSRVFFRFVPFERHLVGGHELQDQVQGPERRGPELSNAATNWSRLALGWYLPSRRVIHLAQIGVAARSVLQHV